VPKKKNKWFFLWMGGGGGKRGNSVYIIKVESASLFKIYMALRKEGYWKEETVKAPFSDVVYLSCR